MNPAKIGLLTIGQSPREDIMTEIRPLFSPHIEILEAGLLDNLSSEEIRKLQPERGETSLVSRLREGSQVELSEKKMRILLPEIIESMKTKMDVNAVGILCTHDFPKTKFSFPVIFPFDSLNFLTRQILKVEILGAVVPLEDQVEMTKKKWEKVKVSVEVKSPYAEGKGWEEIARSFIKEKIDAVVLDCIGYTIKDMQEIQNLLSAPVLLPRIILALTINQLF